MPKNKTRAYRKNTNKKKPLMTKWWIGVVIILIIGIAGIAILRLSEASVSTAPKGPIYWIGDSLSTGMVASGDLASKLEKNGYNPAYINQNPGRSITAIGFANQDALQAVAADNKNVCQGATIQSIVSYCRSHQQKYNPVADAKTVVVFLGTNPELSTDSFSNLQKQLIDKIRIINPKAKIVWGDIASPGNHDLGLEGSLNWERYFTGKPLTPGSPEYIAFVDNYNRNFDATRKRLQNNLYTIYKNSVVLNYGVVSQFKFLWGETTPIDQLIEKTNQRDPNGYLNIDGVHYEAIGSQKLSDYFLARLNDGRFTRVSALPTPIDLAAPLSFGLIEPPATFSVQQAGVGGGCVKQIGFKQNTNFRGCNITSETPLSILPTNSPTKSVLFPNTKLNVCVGSLSTSTKPLNVSFYDKNQSIAVARLEYGTGNELAKLRACGTTNLTVSEVDKITISSENFASLTNITITKAP